MLHKIRVEFERISQHVRLVSRAALETLEQTSLVVFHQHGLIVRVSALLDNQRCTLARAQTTQIRETLLGDHDVEVVLRLVDVTREGYDAADARGVGFGGARRWRVHDAELRVAQEVGGATESVEHSRPEGVCAVRVGVDVNLEWRVHRDDPEAADDLGRVGDLLRAQQ